MSFHLVSLPFASETHIVNDDMFAGKVFFASVVDIVPCVSGVRLNVIARKHVTTLIGAS